jgi:hypothetical protein
MEVHTQVPDQSTRDPFKRLSDLLGGPRIDTKTTAENADTRAPVEGTADSGVLALLYEVRKRPVR